MMNRTMSGVVGILGLLLIAWGAVPSFVAYPYSNSPNSGPANTSELLIMVSYDNWAWLLAIGVILSGFAMRRYLRRR